MAATIKRTPNPFSHSAEKGTDARKTLIGKTKHTDG
jgi:hypothetical protein